MKKTLTGFNRINLQECLKSMGKEFGTKVGVRPVGGNAKGVISGGAAPQGPTLTPIKGGKGLGGLCGKGPALMPKNYASPELKKMGSTTKLGRADVREQP